MVTDIVLSVSGRDGLESAGAAQSQAEAHRNLELVRAASATIHGANGTDATIPIRGQPAGALHVELLEATNVPESFIVRVLGQQPENSVAPVTQIPPQRDIVLQAVGGNGEPGRRGGDGAAGRDGIAGIDATEVLDATPGSDGGNGGAGGNGTNGADGGNGGTIRIYVDEDKTHLLQAVDWEVHGGKGGAAGQHGKGGRAGKGGSGGDGLKWEEQTGYRYKCSSNCLGRQRSTATPSNSMALARNDPRQAMLDRLTTQLSGGTGVQNAVARIAQIRGNMTRDTNGLCTCSGGNGHCIGCDAVPVFAKRNRVAAAAGQNGTPGTEPALHLLPGADGNTGRADIIVRSVTGERTYQSRYQLELIDFDLEDENADGIFEHGEHLFIRRIRVRNSGGMPSPLRPIRLDAIPNDRLCPVATIEGRTPVPQIGPGQTVTLPGSIKVKIREAPPATVGNPSFKETVSVSLRATLPGLNRQLDNFDFQLAVEVQYPLELRSLDLLRSVAQGSQNKLKANVHNKSSKLFGGGQIAPRQAEVRFYFASESGSLLSPQGTWSSNVTKRIGQVQPNEDVGLTQSTQIALTARDHSEAVVHVEFYISSPGAVATRTRPANSTLVQVFDLHLQISASHQFNEDADFLVVTNSETRRDQYEAIGDFIREDLGMRLDVWNASLYGGLERSARDFEEADGKLKCILKDYPGKTIIFLANDFGDLNGHQQIMDICESNIAAKECLQGTSILFLGGITQNTSTQWLRSAIFPVSQNTSDVSSNITDSTTFPNKEALVRSIAEQKQSSIPTLQAYKVESNPTWYLGTKVSTRRQAKQITAHLKSSLPQDKFWVCPVLPDTEPGFIAIWHGLPQSTVLFATEAQKLQSGGRLPPKLNSYDSYNVVCAIPFDRRVSFLFSPQDQGSDSDMKAKDERGSSEASVESFVLSDYVLEAAQLSVQEDLVSEILNFSRRGSFFNNIKLDRKRKPYDEFRIHFPCLETFFRSISVETETLSLRVLEILRLVIAATFPQSKTQIVRSVFMGFGQRRVDLQKCLTQRVRDLLRDQAYSPLELDDFFTSVRTVHSRSGSQRRNTAKVIEARNSKFCKCSGHQYRKGRQTAQKIVPKTLQCTAAEWNARCQALKSSGTRIQRLTTSAQKRRATMSTLKL